MFKRIDGDEALIVQKGVYLAADLYEMDGGLFAKAKGGFIRLKADGSTSHSDVRVQKLITDRPLFCNRFSQLCTQDGEGRKEVAALPTPDDKAIVGPAGNQLSAPEKRQAM